jgi:hypothetical protein
MQDWLPMFEALAPLRGCFKTLYVPSLMEWSPTVLRAIAQGFQGVWVWNHAVVWVWHNVVCRCDLAQGFHGV